VLCRAVLFSLYEETVSKLKSFKSDEDRLNFLQEDIEENIMTHEPERFAEFDKSGDALHPRCCWRPRQQLIGELS
jgi:hypothetical protein